MNKENIIYDKEKFKEIMSKLDGSLQSVFIRVSIRKNAGILDSDLINMRLSDEPINIEFREDGNINIFDSGESNFVIEMDDFKFADIENINEEITYGFMRTPCRAISIWLKNDKFIVMYYWANKEKEK